MHKLLAVFALAALILPAACVTQGPALAQSETPVSAESPAMYHPNSIQPETTLDLTVTASSKRVPDIATVSVGVQANAKTASEAMAGQARAMNAMFDALSAAGAAPRDMQTANLTLYPEMDYVTINEDNGVVRQESRLRGYVASNQLTLIVRDLEKLGGLLDTLVGVGSNTINGVAFSLDDPSAAQNEAREMAVKEALARAELYARASGLRVGRIVTISEQMTYDVPMAVSVTSSRAQSDAPTPVAAGEVGYSSTVTVKFELLK